MPEVTDVSGYHQIGHKASRPAQSTPLRLAFAGITTSLFEPAGWAVIVLAAQYPDSPLFALGAELAGRLEYWVSLPLIRV